MFDWFKKKNVSQQTIQEDIGSLYGTPVDWTRLLQGPNGEPYVPIFFRDPFPYKALSVRTYADAQKLRAFSRWLWENNAWAASLVKNATSFVCGNGYQVKISSEQKRLTKDVQQWIDEWNYNHDAYRLHQETVARSLYDGEVFIRHYPSMDGDTELRFIEPDSVLPGDVDWEGEWSGGIKTPIDDWETPLEYAVWYYDNKYEKIPAYLVNHLKCNVRRNEKRGLPIFQQIGQSLYQLDMLHEALRSGETARQKIAYIKEYEQAGQYTVQSLHNQQQTDQFISYNQYGQPIETDIKHMQSGTEVTIPRSLKYETGPAGNGEAVQLATSLTLSACAARCGYPLWMFTADTQSASYASSVVLDSNLNRTVEDTQNIQIEYWEKIYKTLLGFEIKRGTFPENLFDVVQIVIKAPNIGASRNAADAIQADLLLVKAGVMSLETLATRNNLNLDEEIQKGAKKQEEQTDLNPNTDETQTGNPSKGV
jgi:hypothetical protein